MMKSIKFYSMGVFVVGLFACSVVPKYAPPTLQLPSNFKASDLGSWKYATPNDALPKGHWWELFGDPILNQLESSLLSQNFSREAALARFDGSRAQVSAAYANLLPQVSVKDGVSRGGVWNKGASTSYSVNLQASWELDLWGGVRAAKTGAIAQLDMTRASLANLTLSLQAELAQQYFKLRTSDQQLNMLREQLQIANGLLSKAESRYKAGVVTKTDILDASTQVKSLESQLQTQQSARAQTLNAIAVLLGRFPNQLELQENSATFTLPKIPLVVPSELLERRPDIAIAERTVATLNSKVGVAITAFYPSFGISANAGENAKKFKELFNLTDLAWSLAGNVTQIIFDGGKLKANLEQAKANYREGVANYKQTVLEAFSEVENQLVAIHFLNHSLELQQAALANSEAELVLVTKQYERGTVTYLNVLNAQMSVLNQKKTMLDLSSQAMIARVVLVRALGGGWTITSDPS